MIPAPQPTSPREILREEPYKYWDPFAEREESPENE